MDTYTDELLTQMANGSFNAEPALRARRVGSTYIFNQLLADVDLIVKNSEPVHREGLTQWSLWNRSGQTADQSEDFNHVFVGKRGAAPWVHVFATALPNLLNMRLNKIEAGVELPTHQEQTVFSYDQDRSIVRARFHMPLYTSRESTITVGGQEYRFHANGNIYYMNHGMPHSAKNGHDRQARYHLVWDMLMSQRAVDTMFRYGNDYIKAQGRGAPRVGKLVEGDYPSQPGLTFREFAGRELITYPEV